jgi:8-oxo-dGTP diphosphatase
VAVVRGYVHVESVAAILTVNRGYVLQLRDDRPARIAFPGYWGLFGGERLEGEAPRAAMRREIAEELSLDVGDWQELGTVRYRSVLHGHLAQCAVFAADVTARWSRHRLCEGQAVGVFSLDELPRPIIPLAAELLERHGSGSRLVRVERGE